MMARRSVGWSGAGRRDLAAALALLLAVTGGGGSLAAQTLAPPAQAPATTPAEAPTTAPAPAATEPPAGGSGVEPARSGCADPETRATTIRCSGRLLLYDTVEVFRAPSRWRAKQWAIFSAEVLGVGALSLADKHIHNSVLPRAGHQAGRLAQDFEPLGGAASFGVIGAIYVTGAATGNQKAKGVAVDALVASVIASGLISTTLKYAVGRSRPREGKGNYDFSPFTGDVSFPSGHATQAFTVATVIATEYPHPWVQVVCYAPAALVGYARLRHDAHWASDVAAGALIGIGVGRAVARLNLPLRHERLPEHLGIVPIVGPHQQGVLVAASFK